MALKTLEGLGEIGGYAVTRGKSPEMSWDEFDEVRKLFPVHITDDKNMISFRIQDGPIREVGLNGCQVDTIIETARLMLEGLNKNYPCMHNERAMGHLAEALRWLKKRTEDREQRGVEGTSQV